MDYTKFMGIVNKMNVQPADRTLAEKIFEAEKPPQEILAALRCAERTGMSLRAVTCFTTQHKHLFTEELTPA